VTHAVARTFALLLTLALIAPAPARAADPFELYAISELTGSAGFVGKNEVIALQAFENRLNANGGIDGRPLKFVIQDAASDPRVAVQLTTDLVARKVNLILGASLASTCSAEQPLVNAGPLAFCLSNAVIPKPGSFMFAASVTTANHVAAGLRFARLKGMRRIAAIVTTDTSGQNGEDAINQAVADPANKALKLVDLEHFNPADLSVAAQLARIKAADPDLIVLWTTGVAAGTVLRGLAAAGLDKLPVLISPGNATFAQMAQYASFLPAQLYFTLPAAMIAGDTPDPVVRPLIKELRDAMTPLNGQIDISVTAAWDASLIATSALKKLGLSATPEQLRAYVAGLRNFEGVAGRYDFVKYPQRGISEDSEYIGRWDGSKNAWIGVSKAGGTPL
jgi:branched-chain amino acid transport system substrate-binding protein